MGAETRNLEIISRKKKKKKKNTVPPVKFLLIFASLKVVGITCMTAISFRSSTCTILISFENENCEL